MKSFQILKFFIAKRTLIYYIRFATKDFFKQELSATVHQAAIKFFSHNSGDNTDK
jgi:hypothetical protein